MNILIPMAGAGSRFSREGYTLPKPLIDVDGEVMIKRVIDSFGVSGKYIFIIRNYKETQTNELLRKILNQSTNNNCIIISTDELTRGSTETALLAEKYINNDDGLIILNCDQVFNWDEKHFISALNDDDCDGLVVTYNSDDPKNSFILLDENGYGTKLEEKKVISKHALVGIHYWKRGFDFVDSAKNQLNENEKTLTEFYIAPTYNYLIKYNKKIKTYEVSKDEIDLIGTPKDLEFYLKKKNKYLTSKRGILFDLDGVLADTKSIQMKSLTDALSEFTDKHIPYELIYDDSTTLDKLSRLQKRSIINIEDIPKIYDRKKELTNQLYDQIDGDQYKDKVELLKFLKENNIKFAVITNCNRISAEKLLNKINIKEYVDVLITNNDVINPKPHPEPYIRAMLKLGLNLDEYIILEDSETGLQSAYSAGATVYKIKNVADVNVGFIKTIVK